MYDLIIDALIDSLKLVPFLFITFIILELIEHKLSKIELKSAFGPVIGSILGGIPQCGFSAVAANLFSSKAITMGTLIGVFLATSDEMIPVMLSSGHTKELLLILIFKIVTGMLIGLIIDLIIKPKSNKLEIHELCEHDHCDCEHHSILVSSLIHTLKIFIFILIANLVIDLLIYVIGSDKLSNILLNNNNIFKYLISSLFGFIPNCASSVILTQVYLSNLISIGTLISGLLTGAGIGILLLFKQNKNLKENITILLILYITGVILGLLVDIIL